MRFLQWEQALGLKLPLKSQTRRLVKPNEYAIHGAPGYAELPIEAVLTKPRHAQKWVVGRTYACQRPDGKTMGRTSPIKTIRRERLGDISLEDIFAEGVAYQVPPSEEWLMVPDIGVARQLYAELWNHCGGNWEQEQNDDVWVLEFEKGPGRQ